MLREEFIDVDHEHTTHPPPVGYVTDRQAIRAERRGRWCLNRGVAVSSNSGLRSVILVTPDRPFRAVGAVSIRWYALVRIVRWRPNSSPCRANLRGVLLMVHVVAGGVC